jgi:hypothetical protein
MPENQSPRNIKTIICLTAAVASIWYIGSRLNYYQYFDLDMYNHIKDVSIQMTQNSEKHLREICYFNLKALAAARR